MTPREIFEKYEEGKISFKEFLVELYGEEAGEYWKLYQEIGLPEHLPIKWELFNKIREWIEYAYINKKENNLLKYLKLLYLARQELELKDISFVQGGIVGSGVTTWDYSAKYKDHLLHVHIDAVNGVAVVNMLDYKFDDIETLVFFVNDDITEAYKKETCLNWTIPYVFQILLHEYARANKDMGINTDFMPDPYIDIFYQLMLEFKKWVDMSKDDEEQEEP